MPGIMGQPYPMEFLLTPGKVTIVIEAYTQVRHIYTDGRPLPEDPDPKFHGTSIGRWEGDTLVVETVGFSPLTQLARSVPHSGKMKIVERFRLADPDTMTHRDHDHRSRRADGAVHVDADAAAASRLDDRRVHLRREQPQLRRPERQGRRQPDPSRRTRSRSSTMMQHPLRPPSSPRPWSRSRPSALPRIIRSRRSTSTTEKTITGTVKQFDWTNPHTWIWVDVPNDKGGVDTWGFEGMSPNYLARRGWTKNDPEAGRQDHGRRPSDERRLARRHVREGDAGGRTCADVRRSGATGPLASAVNAHDNPEEDLTRGAFGPFIVASGMPMMPMHSSMTVWKKASRAGSLPQLSSPCLLLDVDSPRPIRSRRLRPSRTPTATIKDLMQSVIDVNADVVWLAVTAESTSKGFVEHKPKTDEEWTKVRHGAIALAEAANLLMMPGRQVARPGEKSETPGVELEPEEMQVLINKDRKTWNTRATALHDAATQTLMAIEAKDADKVFELGATIELACENCHTHYWYPNEKLPETFPSTATEIGEASSPKPDKSNPKPDKKWSGNPPRSRQGHGERRALTLPGALRRHRSAVQLHQVPDDRQPEPKSLEGTGGRSIGLLEAREQSRHEDRIDADSGVANDDRALFHRGTTPTRGSVRPRA